ncbi:UPF0158 family protein [Desulfoluna spongiiphila]|uniref:Uncharacterized protein family (UPF0158) n=1 Tax=Desulfoluna spongiiphila TaxID=419481 RepID=A0A1G5GTJ9_9BACT|nr:UPF0158 family protein [Desulfoluna spongiiphila]SCY54500.1 Uncharacterised protein family (UPF0158) [Desulfoluna spongiiphila]
MPPSVKLSDVIEQLELQSEEFESYFNKKTGEFILVNADYICMVEDGEDTSDLPDWEKEAIEGAREFLDTQEDHIALPSKFEVHEYQIMERFCQTLSQENVREAMCNVLQGRGAFRRFRDNLRRYGIEEDWYRYLGEAHKEIARAWCEDNGITYTP